jgi:hypothetical protein
LLRQLPFFFSIFALSDTHIRAAFIGKGKAKKRERKNLTYNRPVLKGKAIRKIE